MLKDVLMCNIYSFCQVFLYGYLLLSCMFPHYLAIIKPTYKGKCCLHIMHKHKSGSFLKYFILDLVFYMLKYCLKLDHKFYNFYMYRKVHYIQ